MGLEKYKGFSRDAKLLVIFSFTSWLVNSIISFIFPFYLRSLGYGFSDLGKLFSTETFFNALLLLISGRVSDRIGHKKALLLSTFLVFLSRAIQVSTIEFELFMIASAILGFSSALGWPSLSALLSEEVSDEKRDYIFSLSFAVGTIGGALGMFFAGILPDLVDSANPYRKTMLIALIGISAQIFILSLVRVVKEEKISKRLKLERGTLIKILKFSVPSALIGLGAGVTIPYMQLYFNVRFGTSLASIGSLFAIQQLVMGVGMFSMPIFAERYGSVKTIVGFNGTATGLIITLPFSPSFSIAALIYTIRTILMNIVNPLWDSFMLGFFKSEERATAIALRSFAWTVTFGVGNYIGGQIFEYSLSMPFFITGTLYALSMLSFWFFFRKYERG
jgi:MFS family permease